MKRQADEQFEKGDFSTALQSYQAYVAQKKSDSEVLGKMGICHFELGEFDEAEYNFFSAIQTKNKPEADTWRYLGKLHHERFQFEKAIEFYKYFLRETDPKNPFRAGVKKDMVRCGNGMHIRRMEANAVVVNLGEPLNGPGDEFKPILVPGKNHQLYFAKNNPRTQGSLPQSDLYFSTLEMGDWSPPEPFSIFLNSTAFEVPLGFNENGRLFYFFRGKTLFSGDIFVDTIRENKLENTLFVKEFISPVRAWEGDRDLFFFNDSIILFASRRPGGYGGLDLYVATRRDDGWSAPENLGPVINSAYDETSPFLASDGRTLYFSTNDAERSIGGLDIMRSVFLDRSRKWIPAENLGIGFNSAADDAHFMLTPDGSRAFFSSNRKQGLGQRDLYVGIFEQAKTKEIQRSEPVSFHFVPPVETTVSTPSPAVVSPSSNNNLFLPPLRYPEPNMPLTEASFAKLKELADWMKKYPELKVTFAAHTAEEDEQSIGQSALQQVLEVLQSEGASLKNVAIRNAGAAFPLPESDAALNRRIDILLANPEVLPIQVELKELSSSRAFFFQKAMSRLVYQITIPFEESTATSLFQNYPDGNVLESPASGQKTFLNGIYLTWNSALQAQRQAVQNGFPQAQAVPFMRGWELSKSEAEALVSDYPDLSGFISH